MVVREARALLNLLLELREEAVDDVVFVAEMVVQVAWTNFHLLGDRRRGDVRLTDIVEQLQGPLEYSFRSWVRRGGLVSMSSELGIGLLRLLDISVRARRPVLFFENVGQL